MFTVGKAAKMFGISRTALLYYDSIGLLDVRRAENGYRVYSDDDIERLNQIMSLKSAGVPLGEISFCLDSPGSDISSALLKRLGDINREIEASRAQQGVIIKLLKNTDVKQKRRFRPNEWMETLRKAGVAQDNALAWHIDFERQSPRRHRELLIALGFSEGEISLFKSIYESGPPYTIQTGGLPYMSDKEQLTFRPCADFEASAVLIREAFMTVAEEFGITKESAPSNGAFLEAGKLKELSDKGIALFDVFDDGLTGFFALEDAGSGVFYLEKLAVAPGKRHRGIGKRILDFSAEYVREHGGNTISIAIVDENSVLKRWYEQYGFTGTSIKKYEHLPFTVCFMSLPV